MKITALEACNEKPLTRGFCIRSHEAIKGNKWEHKVNECKTIKLILYTVHQIIKTIKNQLN